MAWVDELVAGPAEDSSKLERLGWRAALGRLLQDIIEEPLRRSVVGGPLGPQSGFLFGSSKCGKQRAIQLLRAVPLHLCLDDILPSSFLDGARCDCLFENRLDGHRIGTANTCHKPKAPGDHCRPSFKTSAWLEKVSLKYACLVSTP